MTFDPRKYFRDFAEALFDQLADAFSVFMASQRGLFASLPGFLPRIDLWAVYYSVRTSLNLEQLITRILQAVPDAIVSAVIDQIRLPDSFRYQVCTREQAVKSFFEVIITELSQITTLTGLWGASVGIAITGKFDKLRLLLSGRWFQWLKTILGSWINILIRLILTGYIVFSTVVVLIVILVFVEKIISGKWPPKLQQSTKRKKVKSEEGIIRRREPGGNPP